MTTYLKGRTSNYKSQIFSERFSEFTDSVSSSKCKENISEPDEIRYRWNIIWGNVIFFIVLHSIAIVGMWKAVTVANWKTNIFWYSYGIIGSMGITAGVHRLWSHRSYKARLPLRIFLMLCFSSMFQNNMFEWIRDHRVHHKFTDTNADPHNSSRGFFFSHMGWLMMKKHEKVLEKGRTVDMSDVLADPVVCFQRKYFLLMAIPLGFVIPAHIPWYFFGEEYATSWFVTILRYTLSLHYTWLVNSAAHIWGTKPYDKNINPTENILVAILANGEGWHNYHHVFPWDYKTAELGNYRYNLTTAFLDLMTLLGQAYDLKSVSKDMLTKRIVRSGDGTWKGICENRLNAHDNDHHVQQMNLIRSTRNTKVFERSNDG